VGEAAATKQMTPYTYIFHIHINWLQSLAHLCLKSLLCILLGRGAMSAQASPPHRCRVCTVHRINVSHFAKCLHLFSSEVLVSSVSCSRSRTSSVAG
jgi:hypothetical protein